MKKPLGFFVVGNAIGAYIDDRGAGLDPVRFQVAGFAHGGDDDIGAAEEVGQAARLRMANRDGGIGVHEEKSHGLTDDIAAAKDDGVGAFDLDVIAAQNFHAAGGSAGDQARASTDEAAEIDRMETIYVLGGIHGFEDALGVHLRGKGELDENAVNVVVAIQVFDDGEKMECGDGGRWREKRAGEAELLAGRDFAFNVELRGRIFSDEYCREAWANAGRSKQPDFVTQLGENLVADFLAIQGACGHSRLAFLAESQAATPMIARGCVRPLADGERRNVERVEQREELLA